MSVHCEYCGTAAGKGYTLSHRETCPEVTQQGKCAICGKRPGREWRFPMSWCCRCGSWVCPACQDLRHGRPRGAHYQCICKRCGTADVSTGGKNE